MLQKPEQVTDAILDLANFFETLDPKLYDQGHFMIDGERRCICGWCNARTNHIESDTAAAARTLGLTDQQKNQLFSGNGGDNAAGDAPGPKDAARVLRHLAVTGEIEPDW